MARDQRQTSSMRRIGTNRELDLSLVNRCVDGDTRAWVELVRRFEPTVMFATRKALRVHHIVPTEDRLEDLVAEIFFRLVRDDFAKLRSFQGRSSLACWLQAIAGNYVIDTLRKRKPALSLDDPKWEGLRHSLPDNAPTPDAALDRRESAALLRRLWSHLKPADRRFVHLYYEAELSFDEVARAMETSVGAIYGRKNRIRKKLERMVRRLAAALDTSKHRRL